MILKTEDPLAAYPEVLTMKEVASILRMSVDWVGDHTRRGAQPIIPHITIGRSIRYRREDIRVFLELRGKA